MIININKYLPDCCIGCPLGGLSIEEDNNYSMFNNADPDINVCCSHDEVCKYLEEYRNSISKKFPEGKIENKPVKSEYSTQINQDLGILGE